MLVRSILWLGRRRDFSAGYWIGLPWSAFRAHLADELEAQRRRRDSGEGDGVRREPVERPDRREFLSIPYSGQGPDPLAETA